MQRLTRLSLALLSISAALAAPTAFAAGTITGVTVNDASITLGQSLQAAVQALATPGKGCSVRITMKYADNSTEVPHPGFLAGSFPSTGFYLKPTKAGKVTIIADGSPNSNTANWPACAGSKQIDIQVTTPIVVTQGPIVLRPGTTIPQPTVPATLTGIKQVPYTNHSGETWIEANGTGHCTFTIQSAGVAAQTFATTDAKPFPIKVKIANAPLGSHQWTAKGTGSCTGQASATFSVD